MEQIRSFIAIELPQEVKNALSSLERQLKEKQYSFVKWVEPEGIHLTLKFLGNVASTKIPKIIEAITSVAEETALLSLEISGLGAFPNWQQPRVFWVGLRGDIEELSSLQKAVDTALAPLGFSPEPRSFTPHLTLARLREGASPRERRSFGEWVVSNQLELSLSFQVNAISLMKSQLTPSGAIYSCIAFVKLGSS